MTTKVEERIGRLLRDRGWKLAAAESCTGGLICHRITNIPGSSTYFLGGITAYSYGAKVRLLGVSWNLLEEHGAVSEEVVRAMASGVRQALGADIGISVSGIAGPGGGTVDKPVGMVWIGLSGEQESLAWQHKGEGSRLENKQEFAQLALEKLCQFLDADGKN